MMEVFILILRAAAVERGAWALSQICEPRIIDSESEILAEPIHHHKITTKTLTQPRFAISGVFKRPMLAILSYT
jgi:hypothetical protein